MTEPRPTVLPAGPPALPEITLMQPIGYRATLVVDLVHEEQRVTVAQVTEATLSGPSLARMLRGLADEIDAEGAPKPPGLSLPGHVPGCRCATPREAATPAGPTAATRARTPDVGQYAGTPAGSR